MIWDSTALMTIIDLLIVGSVGYALWNFVGQHWATKTTGTSGGALLLLTGLSVTALYFFADLVVMHVFPLFMSMGATMSAMERLHHEFEWIVALSGICCISFGFAATNRNLFNAMNELVDIEDRLAFAVSGTNDGLWDWNIRTNEDYLSPRWKAILGYEEDELENVLETFTSLIHPEDHDGVMKAVDAHLAERVPYDEEMRLRHKEGHYVWVRIKGQAVWDEQGAPVRMGGSISDITERKQAEDASRKAKRDSQVFSTSRPRRLSRSMKTSGSFSSIKEPCAYSVTRWKKSWGSCWRCLYPCITARNIVNISRTSPNPAMPAD